MDEFCLCGRELHFDDCCGRYLDDDEHPSSAEQLMRSRYAAFALGNEAYLAKSWASATRPVSISLVPDQVWTRLEVLDTVGGGVLASDGIVEFRAHYERDGVPGVLEERSAFAREKSRWVYVGPVTAPATV